MEPIDTQHLDKVISDIATMKSVFNKNKLILQQMMIPGHLIAVAAIGGLSIIIICLAIHLLVGHYGEFSQIPRHIRYWLYGFVAATAVLSSFIKLKGFSISGRNIDPTYSVRRVFQEMFSYKIIHLYAPIVSLMIFFGLYFVYRQVPVLIVPAIVIGIGLLTNFIGMLMDLRLYIFLGYYLLVTAVCIILFNNIPPALAVAGSLGVGFLIFAIVGYFYLSPRQED